MTPFFPGRLYFDMDINLCTMFPDDNGGNAWPDQWYAPIKCVFRYLLERALKSYLIIYEDGKFLPTYYQEGFRDDRFIKGIYHPRIRTET